MSQCEGWHACAMSFLILNENWDEVIELTKRTKALKEGSQE